MKTYNASAKTIKSNWHIIDAQDKILGRLAVRVANILRGKTKPEFTPFVDCGDHVVIINAEKVKVTGRKEDQKFYRSHSGFPHGFKEESMRSLKKRRPTDVVERAVWGMMPHNRLGAKQITKLKVYVGSKHPHEAQKPVLHETTKEKQ